MATLVKTPSGKWKAIIRRAGWPMTVKTFRTQRDAGDWARRTEDDMVRGAFIQRAPGDRMTVAVAMKRYLSDVVPSKRPTTQVKCIYYLSWDETAFFDTSQKVFLGSANGDYGPDASASCGPAR